MKKILMIALAVMMLAGCGTGQTTKPTTTEVTNAEATTTEYKLVLSRTSKDDFTAEIMAGIEEFTKEEEWVKNLVPENGDFFFIQTLLESEIDVIVMTKENEEFKVLSIASPHYKEFGEGISGIALSAMMILDPDCEYVVTDCERIGDCLKAEEDYVKVRDKYSYTVTKEENSMRVFVMPPK